MNKTKFILLTPLLLIASLKASGLAPVSAPAEALELDRLFRLGPVETFMLDA